MIIDSEKIPGDISVATLKALCHLTEVESARPTELAEVAGFSTAACTGMIDRAEAAALMVRQPHPDDRRMLVVQITKAGRKMVESMKPQTATPNTATA